MIELSQIGSSAMAPMAFTMGVMALKAMGAMAGFRNPKLHTAYPLHHHARFSEGVAKSQPSLQALVSKVDLRLHRRCENPFFFSSSLLSLQVLEGP